MRRSVCVERVEARGDQRGERLRHGEGRRDRRSGTYTPSSFDESAVGDEHPNRLDRIQRDAVGAGDDRARLPSRAGPARGRQAARACAPRTAARGRATRSCACRRPSPAAGRADRGARGSRRRSAVRGSTRAGGRRSRAVPGVGEVHVLEDEERPGRSRRSARRTCATPRTAASAAMPPSTPSRVEQRRARSSARSGSSGIHCASISPTLVRVVCSSSISASPARSRTISPSAQNVMPSP